jgi:hypothetical protein
MRTVKSFLSLSPVSPALRHALFPNAQHSGGPVKRRTFLTTSSASTTTFRIARRYIFFFCIGFATPGLYKYYYSTEEALDSTEFRPFILESKERVSPTCSIFNLVPAKSNTLYASLQGYAKLWNNSVWSIQVKQPQLQIARSYTPLPSLQDEDASVNDHALRLLIRLEPRGEVSGYLHSLQLGSTIELRGPQVEYVIPDDVDEVLFIAGGTGIAPALQVARDLFSKHRAIQSKLHILWANRKRYDCLGAPASSSAHPKPSSQGIEALWEKLAWNLFWRSQESSLSMDNAVETYDTSPIVYDLQSLKKKQGVHFNIDCFVDEEKSFINQGVIADIVKRPSKITDKGLTRNNVTSPNDLAIIMPGPSKKIIFVSGPDGFIRYIAGPKQWQNGQEVQGELSGLLGKMDLADWQVWKL